MTKARKSLLIIITTLICVLTFSAISILVLAIYTECNKTTKNVNAADLVIYNATQLKTFIADVRGGNDYTGKVVELGASFTVGEIEPIGYYSSRTYNNVVTTTHTTSRSFNGKFDGKGYKLSSIKIKGYAYCNVTNDKQPSNYDRQWTETYTVRTAMFGNLGASAAVTNLWISGIEYGGHGLSLTSSTYVTYVINASPVAAVFTDCNENATFTNIRVDSPSKFTNGFGNGSGKVENCELRNSQGKGFGVKCINCVFKQQSGYTCSTPFGSGSTGCVSSASKVTGGNSWSSEGGSSHYSAWYAASGYNDGYPTLRKFVTSWTTITFLSSNTTYGTVNKASIQVPSDASTAPFDDYNNSTSISVMIYSQSCGAAATSQGEFLKWTYNSSTKTYTAQFDFKGFYVTFTDSFVRGGLEYSKGGVDPTLATSAIRFYIKSGNTVNITFLTSYGDLLVSKTGAYVAVKYTFNGKLITNGEKESIARNYVVVSVLTSSEHYIDAANVTKETVSKHTAAGAISIDRATMFYANYVERDYDLGIT